MGGKKIKFVRCPVHDLIRIVDEPILELIDTIAFQRLRRIRQLGLAWIVYPGAEHSRFVHLLGAYHLAGRVMNQLNENSGSELFPDDQKLLVSTAAILHDVGHGPFSHMFEAVFRDLGLKDLANHEIWTKKLIKEDPQIQEILNRIDSSFSDRLCNIFDHTYKPYYISALVSSQLDVDRFDYLLRDAHMTGAKYGNFDREWMLRSLSLAEVENRTEAIGEGPEAVTPPPILSVVVDARRGMSALEQHILGRHYMYKHVYYHKTIRAAEGMLRMILKRAAALIREGTLTVSNNGFTRLACGENITHEDYIGLHDFLFLSWIDDWARSAEDNILKDISFRFVSRKIFGVIPAGDSSGKEYADKRDKIKTYLKDQGKDPDYYFIEDEAKDIAYKNYAYWRKKGKDPEEIWYLDENGRSQPLSGYDSLLDQAKKALEFSEERWYIPKELTDQVKKIL